MFKKRSFGLAFLAAASAVPTIPGAMASCDLNTVDMSAYVGVATAADGCQVSDKQLSWMPVKCKTTASTVTAMSASITSAADAGTAAVTDAGTQQMASAAGGLSSAYQAAQNTSNVAASTSMANYAGEIESRKAKLKAALEAHQTNLKEIQTHAQQLNAQNSQCSVAQAELASAKLMMSNPATAAQGTALVSEKQSKITSIVATCSELGGVPAGADCQTCNEALSNLAKAKEEQGEMVSALTSAMASSQTKLAAAQACQAADTAVADSNKSMVDAMKQGMANADADTSPGTQVAEAGKIYPNTQAGMAAAKANPDTVVKYLSPFSGTQGAVVYKNGDFSFPSKY